MCTSSADLAAMFGEANSCIDGTGPPTREDVTSYNLHMEPFAIGLRAYSRRKSGHRILLQMAIFATCVNIVRISSGWAYRSYEKNRFEEMAIGLHIDPSLTPFLTGLCLLLILQIALAGVLVWWRLQAASLLAALLPLSVLLSRALTHDKPGSWTTLLGFLLFVWLAMTVLSATTGWRHLTSSPLVPE